MGYEKEQKKEDSLSLSWETISFLKDTVSKKQNLLSYDSQMDDRRIYQQVELIEQMVKVKQISLPVDFCVKCFHKLNKDYAERNVAGTGIGKLGSFLIDYVLNNTDLARASRMLYPSRTDKKNNLIQYEWYNHTIAGLMDLALERKKTQIAKSKIMGIQQSKKIILEKS